MPSRVWPFRILPASSIAALAVFLAVLYGPGLPASEEELRRAFSGKRVVICGASYGIGAEVAKSFARVGARVFLTARSEDKLRSVAQQCRQFNASEVHTHEADLAVSSESRSMIATAEARLGGIDVLVLNHILGMYEDWAARVWRAQTNGTLERDLDWVEHMFAVNTFSWIRISSYALPALAASSGRIVVVGSAAGKVGLPRVAPYAATKHAVFGYFDSLRQDLLASRNAGLHGVGITTAVLGSFGTESARTGTAKYLDEGIVQWWPPADAAEALLKAAARGWKTVYTPWQQVRFLPLLHPWFPETLDSILRYVTTSGERVESLV
mmetsp:Transcript_8106/g.20223  ORF Transcript_8106/g.20223 Transcript_8106/m.20223 type:complete len:325 (-) Transcript_8106:49-1023(-)